MFKSCIPLSPSKRPTLRQRWFRCLLAVCCGTITATSASSADSPERAKEIVAAVCAGCHGLDGNSTIPTIPKLARRHPDYLARELGDFCSGKRKSDIMTPICASLDPQDHKTLGIYFAGQIATSEKVLDGAAAELGRKIYMEGNEASAYPACAGCHVEDGSGNKRFPRLAGQHREYLIEQMMLFKKNVRTNDASRFMREVAKRMSDEEIRAVAEYLTGL